MRLARADWKGRIDMRVPAGLLGAMIGAQAVAETPLMSTRVVTGLSQPVFVTAAPGDAPGRLFIVQKTGLIRIAESDGTIRATPFLNIASLVNTIGESGLLSMVFDPNYATNGYFYINYNPPGSSASDTQVSRYRRSMSDPNIADATTATTILRFPYGNRGVHRAGWMGFDPAGYLFVSTGDGGEGDPDLVAQDLTSLRGKILRLDVNGPDGAPGSGDEDGFPGDASKNYRIPPTNPFAGTGNAQEIWAYGLRNPWRCSLDRLTHDLWIGDVGQGTKEEIDFQPAGAGGRNYGWRCMEGTVCTNYSGCTCPAAGTLPLLDYPRTVGNCVIGGYVYRGCAMPDLRGTYFYADYGATKLFSLRYDGATLSAQAERTAELLTELHITSVVSLGEDSAGEVYICSSAGSIYKIGPRTVAQSGVVFAQQPADTRTCYHGTAVFSTTVTSPDIATGTLNYRWYRGNTPLSDGTTGSGSTISGAMTAALTIANARGTDAGQYSCHITTPCETVSTRAAQLIACEADFNCDSTSDFFDYLDFVQALVEHSAAADFDGDGVVDFFDYLDFVQAFSSGC